MDALYLSDKYGEQVSWQTWLGITRSMGWLTHNWQRPDEGIWEGRGRRQEFLLSRVMCWVAFDRAIRLARKRGPPAAPVGLLGTSDANYQNIPNAFLCSPPGAL